MVEILAQQEQEEFMKNRPSNGEPKSSKHKSSGVQLYPFGNVVGH
jgi:hypothetical protein